MRNETVTPRRVARELVGLIVGCIYFGMAMLIMVDIAHAGTAFYKRQEVSGLYKVCYYNYLGSEVAITIRSTGLCPLTIQVD